MVTRPHSHRLDASCEFYQLDESVSSSFIKPVDSIRLQQACDQTCLNLIFAHSTQVVSTTCIKLVDKKSQQSTCIWKDADCVAITCNQTCQHEAGESDATHPDIGLIIARNKRTGRRLAATCAFTVI